MSLADIFWSPVTSCAELRRGVLRCWRLQLSCDQDLGCGNYECIEFWGISWVCLHDFEIGCLTERVISIVSWTGLSTWHWTEFVPGLEVFRSLHSSWPPVLSSRYVFPSCRSRNSAVSWHFLTHQFTSIETKGGMIRNGSVQSQAHQNYKDQSTWNDCATQDLLKSCQAPRTRVYPTLAEFEIGARSIPILIRWCTRVYRMSERSESGGWSMRAPSLILFMLVMVGAASGLLARGWRNQEQRLVEACGRKAPLVQIRRGCAWKLAAGLRAWTCRPIRTIVGTVTISASGIGHAAMASVGTSTVIRRIVDSVEPCALRGRNAFSAFVATNFIQLLFR